MQEQASCVEDGLASRRKVQSTSMSSKLATALALSASFLVLDTVINAALAQAGPAVIFADGQQQPVRTAYNSRPGPGGGGFIEFLFSGGQSGTPPQQSYPRQPQYQPTEPQYQPLSPQRQRTMTPREDEQAYEPATPAKPGIDPKFEKQMVDYSGKEPAGTIIVDTPSRFLYLVQGDGKALRYGIGVGRPGFTWAGVKQITAKKEWPAWTPPPEMLKRRPDLPRHMVGGPDNPLGARAMYLGSSLYRIHGSNEPWTIGTAVSSGCIRMRNEDVIDLYGRVNVGARVVVI